MFEKLGKAKYVVPLLIGIVAACVMSVMFYPMANMEMKGLPFAVLSLDEGVETPQGDMNVGDTLVENITSATAAEDGEESPIAWTKVGSQKELDEALENGEYYGAIIVPADFSAQQMGVDVDVETIPEGSASDGDGAAANPMSGMVSLQLAIMPLFMVSMMTGLFLSRIFGKKTDATSAERWKSIGIQAAYAVVASLIVSLCAFCMLLWIAGIEAPMDAIVPFMWLASFCVMLVFIGAFNISTALGGLLALVGFALGMMTGTFPFEALPAFWQDWVYPWAPQRFMSEGIRAILYLDAGAWNAGSLPLLIVGAVGAMLTCIAALVPGKKDKSETVAA